MGFAQRAFVAAGAGFVAAAVVGCGSSGGSWLSASQSSHLTEQLNRVTQALDSGQCAQAQQYLADFQSSVDNMSGVNSTLIGNLDQGASTIQSLTNRECRTVRTTPRQTKTKTTTDTTTTSTSTATTQTFTNPATVYTTTTSTYTQPVPSNPSTSTSGGAAPTIPATTTTTGGSTTTPPPPPASGGGGLGTGYANTTTGGDTSTVTTTGDAGAGN